MAAPSTGDAIYMRGFDTSNSIFADGIRDLGSISRDVFNIESVEVQKGAGRHDNGRSAPREAVNTVSKQAFLEDAVAANLSGGIDGQKRATVDWNQTLGLAGSAGASGRDVAGPRRARGANTSSTAAGASRRPVGFGLGTDSRTAPELLLREAGQCCRTVSCRPSACRAGCRRPVWSHLVGNPVDPGNFYGTRADHDDSTARMATSALRARLLGAS